MLWATGWLLATVAMVYAVVSSEDLPHSMIGFGVLDSTDAILTWNRLKALEKSNALKAEWLSGCLTVKREPIRISFYQYPEKPNNRRLEHLSQNTS